jgi:hypothetical protein
MILEWLLGAVVTVVEAFLNLLPDWTLPDWWASAASTWSDTAGRIDELGMWVPVSAIINGAIFLLAVMGIALAVRVGRIALSLLTAGGGSAA